MSGVTPISPELLRIAATESPTAAPRASATGGAGFSEILNKVVTEADGAQKASDAVLNDFMNGKGGSPHEVMLALNKADLSFRMMLEVRNKLLDAYQEVMRTQV
jgi:flagellar hook-basal body complex protein FliE